MKHASQNRHAEPGIYQRFLTQVEKHRTKVALIDARSAINYGQLNHSASILAELLQAQGLEPDSLVVIPGKRNAQTIVAMLAVLKAGGAFLPLDCTLPEQRAKQIIADSKARYALSEGDIAQSLRTALSQLDNIGNSDCPASQPDNLAYTIYTSGTSGRAKGVMIEQRHLLSYIDSVYKDLHLHQCDSFAIISTLAADLSYTLLWCSLLQGATLHILDEQLGMNAHRFQQYFSTHVIDCLKIVPSQFFSLQPSETKTAILPRKCLIFGGEACQPKALYDIYPHLGDCQLYNHYGPTEATIGATFFSITASIIDGKTAIPIGKPLSHAKVCVLNAEGKEIPVGAVGELYLGGSSIARGYLHQKTLDETRFLNKIDPMEGRFYKTGDQVRVRPDGNLVFLGRMDKQINLHGHRIELADIESVISQHERVKATAVVPVMSEDKACIKHLVAYVVSQPDPAVKPSTALFSFDGEAMQTVTPLTQCLNNWLTDNLPAHMIPGRLTILDQLPLTINGKIDYNLLTEMASNPLLRQDKRQIRRPRNAQEKSILTVWQDCLQIPTEQLSIDATFFELGGTSLLAIQVVEKLQGTLGQPLTVDDIYEHNTIALLSAYIDTAAFHSESSQHLVNFHLAKRPSAATIHRNYLIWPHGLAGDLLALYPLANALQDSTVDTVSPLYCVGLKAPGHGADETLFQSGEAMLQAYANTLHTWLERDVSKQKASHSISLCGWSYGAGLAIFLANLLQEKGHVIDKLVIIDGDPPTTDNEKPRPSEPIRWDDDRYCLERNQLITHYQNKYGPADKTSHCPDRELFNLIRFLESPDTCHEQIKRCNQVAISNRLNFAQLITPRSLRINAVLLCQSSQSSVKQYRQLWHDYLTALNVTSLEYQQIEGDHWSMLNNPALQVAISAFIQSEANTIKQPLLQRHDKRVQDA